MLIPRQHYLVIRRESLCLHIKSCRVAHRCALVQFTQLFIQVNIALSYSTWTILDAALSSSLVIPCS